MAEASRGRLLQRRAAGQLAASPIAQGAGMEPRPGRSLHWDMRGSCAHRGAPRGGDGPVTQRGEQGEELPAPALRQSWAHSGVTECLPPAAASSSAQETTDEVTRSLLDQPP